MFHPGKSNGGERGGCRRSGPRDKSKVGAIFERLEGRELLSSGPADAHPPVVGFVFVDADGDGKRGISESPAPGFTVYGDVNQNQEYDPGVDYSAVSGNDGSFSFDVPQGVDVSTVRIVLPEGYVATTPPGGGTDWFQNNTNGPPGLRVNFGVLFNTAPTVAGPADQAASEGVATSFDLGSFSDSDSPRHEWFLRVNWGEGGGDSFAFFDRQSFSEPGAIAPLTHTYDDDGVYTVSVRIIEVLTTSDINNGFPPIFPGGPLLASGTAMFKVTVGNVAPTATFYYPPDNIAGALAGNIGSVGFANVADSRGDVSAGLRYSFDLDGDGVNEIADSSQPYVQFPASLFRTAGTRTIRGRVADKDGASTDYQGTLTVFPAPAVTTFAGGPNAAPVRITDYPFKIRTGEFDFGGEGVAYHDTDTLNQGGTDDDVRATGVDVSRVVNGGYGPEAYALSFTHQGEWVNYTIDAGEAGGTFDVGVSVSHLLGGGTMHLELDGHRLGGTLSIPQTGAWNTWKMLTLPRLQFPAGRHVLRLVFDTAGHLGYVGNVKDITFTPSAPLPPPPPPSPTYTGTPYKGKAVKVAASGATTIELENFDDGGEQIAYHDTDAANITGQYRATGVDVHAIGSGFGVGYIKAGEWLKYTLDVAADGQYALDFRLASLLGGGKFHLEIDGVKITSTLSIAGTASWTTYATSRLASVSLKVGKHVLKIAFDAADRSGYVANFDWMKLTRV